MVPLQCAPTDLDTRYISHGLGAARDVWGWTPRVEFYYLTLTLKDLIKIKTLEELRLHRRMDTLKPKLYQPSPMVLRAATGCSNHMPRAANGGTKEATSEL